MKFETILQMMWVWAKLMTQLAVMLTRAVLSVATWGAAQLSTFLEKRADAQRSAPKPAPATPDPKPAAATRRVMTDAEIVTNLVPSARELMKNPNVKAESYAKVAAPLFAQKYEAFWRAGQRNKVPQELWPHMGKDGQQRAIFAMLYNHKAKTGRDMPYP